MQSIEEKHRGIGRNKRVNKSLICICVVTTAIKITVFTSSFNEKKMNNNNQCTSFSDVVHFFIHN